MEIYKFTDCVEVVGSACPSFEGEKHYISTGAVEKNMIDETKVEIVSYDEKPSRANLVVEAGTLLFAKMQATEKTILIDDVSEQYVYSTGFCAVKPIETIINQNCLYHLLMSDMFLKQKDKNCSGATQKAITNAGLKKIIISVPPLEQQDSIAEKLDLISELIKNQRKGLQKLDELINSRFVEMFGDPEYNTKNLPVFKLSKLCKVGSSKRIYQSEQSTAGIPFLRISDLNERIDKGRETSELFIPFEKYTELHEQGLVPEFGDILVTSRGTLGKCYIVKRTDNFYFQDGMISWLSEMDENVTSLYIAHLFAMPGIQKQIANLQAGSTVAYLSIAMLKKLDIMLPPIEMQHQFAAFVHQVEKLKSEEQKKLEQTQTLFDSLMQKYFG